METLSATIAQLQSVDLTVRVGLTVLANVFIYLWMRYVTAPASVGTPRIVRAVGMVPVLLFLSILFDVRREEEFVLALYQAANGLWLTLSKTWSFCLNRGELVKCLEARHEVAFAVQLLFPVVVELEEKRITDDDDPKGLMKRAYKDAQFRKIDLTATDLIKEVSRIAFSSVIKVSLMSLVAMGYVRFAESGHAFWRDVCVGWFMYGTTSLIQDLNSLPTLLFLNLKTAPNFNRPWIAQSMQELWSRRYNLTTGQSLRDLVYDPICEGRWIHGPLYFSHESPPLRRRVVGVLATFTVSGALHTLLMWYSTYSEIPVLYGVFFMICGCIAVAETALKSYLKQTGSYALAKRFFPSWLRVIYVHCVIYALLHFFFLTELTKAGFPEQMVKGMMLNLGLAPYLFD